MDPLSDTYARSLVVPNAGIYLSDVGSSAEWMLGADLGDEIVEVVLRFDDAANPEAAQLLVEQGISDIGDDAAALAAAQASLEIPAPVDPGDIDHNDLASRSAADAHPASAITNTPAGNIAATTVQAAIDELDTEKQPLDATLTALAGVSTAADKLIYATGSDTFTTTDLTAAARTVLDDASTSAMRTTLGLAIGTDVQAQDAELAAIAGLTSAADKVPYFTGSGTAALADFPSVGRTLIAKTSVYAQREMLGTYQFIETFIQPPSAWWASQHGGTGNSYQQDHTSVAWLYAAGLQGLFALETGAGTATTDAAARYQNSAGSMYLADGLEVYFKIGCNGVTNLNCRFGLRSDAPAAGHTDVTNGIYFEANTGVGTNWLGCTAAASTRTKTSTGYALSNNNQLFTWLRIKFVNGTTGAVFGHWDTSTDAWVDDLTVATNIPTAGANRGARVFAQIMYNGTTSRKLVIDTLAWRLGPSGDEGLPLAA